MAGFEENFWKIIRTYCLNDSNKEAYNIENTIGVSKLELPGVSPQ